MAATARLALRGSMECVCRTAILPAQSARTVTAATELPTVVVARTVGVEAATVEMVAAAVGTETAEVEEAVVLAVAAGEGEGHHVHPGRPLQPAHARWS